MQEILHSMIPLIHETKAVSIWDHTTGPVFWYAASVPGPFYVNTELVIGPALAAELLDKITAIVAHTADSAERAKALDELIMGAYQNSPPYQYVIGSLAAKAATEFPSGTFDVISGGERRDWLFSIPLAHLLGLRHVFLFKNGNFYCASSIKTEERALHVADLINNAASYFDLWFPILIKARLSCVGTLCVNTRGTKGLQRLHEHGLKTIALNAIDLDFFQQSCTMGLVSAATVEEIAVYFESAQKWAMHYLFKDPAIFGTAKIDKKSFERMQNFFRDDPWNLRNQHKEFFDTIDRAIAQRLQAA